MNFRCNRHVVHFVEWHCFYGFWTCLFYLSLYLDFHWGRKNDTQTMRKRKHQFRHDSQANRLYSSKLNGGRDHFSNENFTATEFVSTRKINGGYTLDIYHDLARAIIRLAEGLFSMQHISISFKYAYFYIMQNPFGKTNKSVHFHILTSPRTEWPKYHFSK